MVVFTIIQCKSTSQQATTIDSAPIPVILLLQEDTSPADLSLIKSLSVESMKRISRSQNKWMLKIAEDQKVVDDLIKNLKNDEKVFEVSVDEQNQLNQNTNTKSGKSGPVKN